jgi:hypothetical protein
VTAEQELQSAGLMRLAQAGDQAAYASLLVLLTSATRQFARARLTNWSDTCFLRRPIDVGSPRRTAILELDEPMTSRALAIPTLVVLSIAGLGGQAPAPVDTSTLGPQVGAPVPAFSGIDQFGKPHTLASTYGPKGAMLVFFRSADW